GSWLASQLILGLHRVGTGGGSLELEADALATIQLGGWRRCRDDEIDVPVIKLIHERNEPARLIFMQRIEHGYVGNHHRLVLPCNLDVILLAARARTHGHEVEPDDAA